MLTLRPAEERGHNNLGWLDARHSFSFGDYYDPKNMGYRTLRVLNDDRIAPGKGFGMHPHNDMEIMTWIVEGALQHRDSLGNGAVIRSGEFQYMSAGSGILHSEFNPSETEKTRLLQIWIQPRAKGLTPKYGERKPTVENARNAFLLLASPDGADGSIQIEADASTWLSRVTPGSTVSFSPKTTRYQWIQIVRGDGTINGMAVAEGDGVATNGEALIEITGGSAEMEVLLFDLP